MHVDLKAEIRRHEGELKKAQEQEAAVHNMVLRLQGALIALKQVQEREECAEKQGQTVVEAGPDKKVIEFPGNGRAVPVEAATQ